MYQENTAIEQSYRNPVVRDLAWAIASPPLMRPAGLACQWFSQDWYLQRYRYSSEWLKKLDRDPTPLVERMEAQKDRRLGSYFETLWAFWLEADTRFRLIERNLPIREGGNTLGELDLIVNDSHSGLNYHWEVAVKFYLGEGDTRQADNWHGPGRRDRLDLKLEHLKDRQSVICRLPQTQEVLRQMAIEIAGCAVILKGRLFYPYAQSEVARTPAGAADSHLRSQWYRLTEFISTARNEDIFRPMIGAGWMSDHGDGGAADSYSLAELLDLIEQGVYRLPLYLMRNRDNEARRMFVVADNWGQ